MKGIIDGVQRFRSEVYPDMADRFRELADGQSPEALFVTCSDSRVDPSLITQTDPGEIFVIRNAGNIVPTYGDEVSIDCAVEYAVAVLGVRDVIVCGHSGCGAVGGALAPDTLSSVPAVQKWVGQAKASAVAVAELPEGERLPEAVRHNVLSQLENLKTHPSVARALAAGDLTLHGWVYDIGSGRVTRLTEAKVAA